MTGEAVPGELSADAEEAVSIEAALTDALARIRALETILTSVRPALASVAVQGGHTHRAVAAAALGSMDALGI